MTNFYLTLALIVNQSFLISQILCFQNKSKLESESCVFYVNYKTFGKLTEIPYICAIKKDFNHSNITILPF